MKFTIEGNPDYGSLVVQMRDGERLIAESGAMSRMEGTFGLRSRLAGGLVQAILRKIFGGESLLVGEYTAQGQGRLGLSAAYPGTVLHRRLEGDSFILTAGSYLASTPGIDIDTRFGGLRALFSGEGAFHLRCHGVGDLFFAAYGGIIERDVEGELVVDTGHVVAWESGLDYTISGMGGLKQTALSGEGLVMRFRGQGRIYLQTRNLGGLVHWLSPFCIG